LNATLEKVSVISHYIGENKNHIHRIIEGDLEPFAKKWYLSLSHDEQKKLFVCYGWNGIGLGKNELDRVFNEVAVTDSNTKGYIIDAYLDANYPPTKGNVSCSFCKSEMEKRIQEGSKDSIKTHTQKLMENLQ